MIDNNLSGNRYIKVLFQAFILWILFDASTANQPFFCFAESNPQYINKNYINIETIDLIYIIFRLKFAVWKNKRSFKQISIF